MVVFNNICEAEGPSIATCAGIYIRAKFYGTGIWKTKLSFMEP